MQIGLNKEIYGLYRNREFAKIRRFVDEEIGARETVDEYEREDENGEESEIISSDGISFRIFALKFIL